MRRTLLAVILTGVLSTFAVANAQTTAPAKPTTPAPAMTAPATTAPATTAPATTAPATTAPAPTARTTRHTTTGTATGYPTEEAAKTACGADTVVWGNPSSKVWHVSGSRYYGKTKRGSYMCQQQAQTAGYHAAKSSK